MMASEAQIEWLMQGDPAVRWQTMRDLMRVPESEWQAERLRIPKEGWGVQFLEALTPEGKWPESRWTGSVWTLLTLIDLGFPADHIQVREAAYLFMHTHLTAERASDQTWLLKRMDLCHLGFWLRIGAYFGTDRERLVLLSETIFGAQFADGGWNCRMRCKPKTKHSSFHTTFNVLDGLKAAASSGLVNQERFRVAEARAMEFMLMHKMYRSDRTGDMIDERFTHLAYPSHWHYTVLRGLDYMRDTAAIGDPRLEDPLAFLQSRQNANGRWPVEHRIPGISLFDMEKMGKESRWNTLRALRVLQAREMPA